MKSLNKSKYFVFAFYASLIILISACGGGGGGGGSGNNGSTQTIATESAPVASLVQLDGYMPLSPGDEWTYTITDSHSASPITGKRSVSAVAGRDPVVAVNLTETEGAASSTALTLKKSDGVYTDYTNDPWFPHEVRRVLGTVRDFAFPAYAIGEERTTIRQGVWDEDLDGDGKSESFRIEQVQIFRGLEQTALSWGNQETARFTTTFRFTIIGSKNNEQSGVVATEEVFLAKGLGPVKYIRASHDLEGTVVSDQTWTVTSLKVAGKAIDSEGSTHRVIDLPHNDLVYDSARDLYYASVPVGTQQNTIAIINPKSGEIGYSPQIGVKPNQLALSADNNFLFVSLDGDGQVAGQIVKLSMPSFSEVQRISIPTTPFNEPIYATDIAVSPNNSDVIAVSVYMPSSLSTNFGILLFNGTQLATKTTPVNDTATSSLAFNSDGSILYARRPDWHTDIPLHKIAVASDGLTITDTSITGPGELPLTLDGGNLYFGSYIHSAADLSLTHDFQLVHTYCKPIADVTKIACLSGVYDNKQIAVFDKNNFGKISGLHFSATFTGMTNLVTARKGMIAFSYYYGSSAYATGLYLLENLSF